MRTVVIEATNEDCGGYNWGKFLVGRFEPSEWARPSSVSDLELSVIAGRGWTPKHIFVLDLQTGEGAMFLPGGSPSHDLKKHKVWVCPLFEPFLGWLYKQDLADLGALPPLVQLDAESALYGYRRPGLDKAPERAAYEEALMRAEERRAKRRQRDRERRLRKVTDG